MKPAKYSALNLETKSCCHQLAFMPSRSSPCNNSQLARFQREASLYAIMLPGKQRGFHSNDDCQDPFHNAAVNLEEHSVCK